MKRARWFGIIYLSLILWLLLFPPWKWMESRGEYDGPHFTASYNLGNHWRFSIPRHWEWSEDEQRSFLVPDIPDDWSRRTQIDYQLMLYEAVTGLVALTLLFLLLPALGMPFRKMTACAKVEITLMRTRIRNWRSQDRKRTMT